MRRNIVPKILTLGCFFVLCFSQLSLAEEKRYPPYPDVWERVFMDNIDERGLEIAPIQNGDSVVCQRRKADANGDLMENKGGGLAYLSDALLFFQGKVANCNATGIRKQQSGPEYSRATHSSGSWLESYDLTYGSGSDLISRDVPLKDGGRIRWIKALITDDHDYYDRRAGYKKKVMDGVLLYQFESGLRWAIQELPHTAYYNRPTLLEKVDNNGKVLWQKVYLYFHPWWRTTYWKEPDHIDSIINFMYLKLGTLALLDEDRMFLYFGGARKIFRLAPDGNPKTADKNLIVIEYRDYKEMTEGLIKRLHDYQEDTPRLVLNDYDYLGEQLARKRGIDITSAAVARVMKQHQDIAKDIDLYYREMEKKRTR